MTTRISFPFHTRGPVATIWTNRAIVVCEGTSTLSLESNDDKDQDHVKEEDSLFLFSLPFSFFSFFSLPLFFSFSLIKYFAHMGEKFALLGRCLAQMELGVNRLCEVNSSASEDLTPSFNLGSSRAKCTEP